MAYLKNSDSKDVLARALRRTGAHIIPGAENRPGLLSLTQAMYPSSDIARPEYVAWQYDQNPAGPAVIRLASLKGEVIAQYAYIPLVFRIRGALRLGSLALNTMTHPQHQAKGLHMLLAENGFEQARGGDIDFTIGFPNPFAYNGCVRHLQFKDMGELPLWVLPLDLAKAAKMPTMRVLQPALSVYLRVFSFREAGPIEEVKDVDASFDQLMEACRSQAVCLVERNQAYLRWRFLQHPTRRYRMWAIRSGSEVKGYVVTRLTGVDGVRCGMVVDCLVREGHSARVLLAHAISELQREGADLIGCLMPNNTFGARALRSLGFQICPRRFLPQPFPVIFRWHAQEPSPQELFSLEHWYLTMGDYDAV